MIVENALVRTTVRVMAGKDGEEPFSVGTGFYYKVQHPQSGNAKILILTNKHVIKGADYIRFVHSYADSLEDVDEHNQPVGRIDKTEQLPIAPFVFDHPDPDIDLCAIDVTCALAPLINSGKKLRTMILDSSWMLEEKDKSNVRDIEQVLVVGYPRGIWDHHNNMPISRIGNTATHPLANYQNKADFLIDVAAFQGSSGSPVFSYESPMFRQKDGSFTPGTKVNLIGVIWGVIESSVEGELKVMEIPSALKHVPVMNASLSLAIALHAEKIRDLDTLILPTIKN
ncbi:S1 family peptidase [Vibrio sp. PNB22_8_1]|uniref:S1 family peptidase n=1 Tax=unclassified Vibrio TaxID=2614977 RepID=UPI00406A9C45